MSGENYLSTTGTPKLAGVCPRCGGQVYQGLTHQCSTSVTPTQQVIVVGNSKMTEALKAALKGKESIPVASPQATRPQDKRIGHSTACLHPAAPCTCAAQPAAGTTPGQHHKEHCGECENDWNCYCEDGPHTSNQLCPECDEASEKERLKAMEWGEDQQNKSEGTTPQAERPLIEQLCRDLNSAHDEILRAHGCHSEDFYKLDWPEWSPQANSIRWAEKLLKKRLAKTTTWTYYPETGDPAPIVQEARAVAPVETPEVELQTLLAAGFNGFAVQLLAEELTRKKDFDTWTTPIRFTFRGVRFTLEKVL